MFEEELAGDAMGLLQHLEGQMMMLSEPDQEFVLGCRHAISAGAALTAGNKSQLRKIASTLTHAGHNTLGDGLSMGQVVHDLANALHMLSPDEKAVIANMARKLKAGEQLMQDEIARVLQIYTEKGF